MRIREYTPADLEALKRMHAAQGFPYEFPDLTNPLFISKLVLEDDASEPLVPQSGTRGKPLMAALLRLTCEAYLLADPAAGAPRQRWERIHALERAAEREAYRKGLDDAHCWLPPAIARQFGRRLRRLGWVRDDVWTPFCKRIVGSQQSTVES